MKKRNDILSYIYVLIFSVLFAGLIEWKVYPLLPFSFKRCVFVIVCINIMYIFLRVINNSNIDFFSKKSDNNYNKFFVFISIIFGLIFSLMIPFHEIPDEITHLNMIYEERNLNIVFTDINNGYYGDENIQNNNTNKINKNKYFDFSKKINNKHIFSIPNYKIIRHLPQYFAMIIGEILKLPVILYLTLIELFALVFYVYVCSKALKLMPYKKIFFGACMLLPVCIQQMASVSYDVVLLSACFLYIATIFNYKFEKKKIDLKDISLLLLYLFIIAICKLPYGSLILLLFILPIDKIDIGILNKRITGNSIKKLLKNKLFIIFLILALVLIFFITFKVLMSFSYGRVLIGSIVYFRDTASLLKKSIDIFFLYYNESIFGDLGTFNIKTPLFIEALFYLMLIIMTFFITMKINNKEIIKKYSLKIYDYIIIYFTVFVLGYLIILSMFPWTLNVSGVLNWNDLSMAEIKNYLHFLPYIGGVQGRYFIPLIPLVYLPISSKKMYSLANKFNPISYSIIYYILEFIFLFVIVLFRFWV